MRKKFPLATLSFLLASAGLVTAPWSVAANESGLAQQSKAETPVTPAKDAKDLKETKDTKEIAVVAKPINIADMAAWQSVSTVAVAPNGKWVAWRIAAADGDSTLFVKAVDGKEEYKFPDGQGSGAIEFSADGSWMAFTSFMTKKDQDAAKKAKKPTPSKVSLVDLKTGKATVIDKVRKFAFPKDAGQWIAMHKDAADATPSAPASAAPGSGASATPSRPKGSDLILRNLQTGSSQNIGNVAEFGFDKQGRYLAYTIDANDKAGNSVMLTTLSTGVSKVLDDGEANYEKLLWTDKGDGLTVLKGVEDKAYQDKLWSAMGFRFDENGTQTTLIEPSKLKDFPEGMTLSNDAQPRWSKDFAWISFGVKEAKKKPKDEKKEPESDDKANLVLWHHQDKRLPTQQKVQQEIDKKRSSTAVYRLAEQKFIRLGDEQMTQVSLPMAGDWALGQDDSAYQRQASMDGRRYTDVYAISLKTGEKRLLQKQARWTFGLANDGRHYLHYKDGHFFSTELSTGKAHNLTAGLTTSFIDMDDDHNVDKPPVSPFGWSSDGRHVLLSDGWDIWKAAADGSKAVMLSQDGKRDQVRYQRRLLLDPNERGIDLSKPQIFSAYGEWNKKAGFLRVEPNGNTKRLAFADAAYRRLLKSEKSDVFVWSKETATMAPDIYVGNAQLEQGRQLTELSAQEKNYTMGAGAQLIDYVGTDGKKLQAALFLPANYQPGKAYPTVVYIYEKLSQGLHSYVAPALSGSGFNRSLYTSNGYAVLMPDISYRLNDPGMSAKESVLPALQAAINTGVVDAKRVGLQGHSWGGYQTSFLITQTNAFKAAVAGAALTNMISMYSLVYKNSGGTNQAIFESSQGRFLGTYNDNWEAYVRNSPVFFAKNVTTPLLMLQNDADGAVDYTQGVEYFNTLRRAGKDVIMLEYPGENHGLAKKPNQKDYMQRMKEFFDFHLKDVKAPDWVHSGVAWLKMDEHLKERAAMLAPAAKLEKSEKSDKSENTEKKESKTSN